MYKDLMDKLMMQQDLTRTDLFQMVKDVINETLTTVQIMGFQMAFLMKDPTPEELSYYVQAMQAHCHKIPIPNSQSVLEVTATGDGKQPGKLTTATALVAAAAGIPVVKQVRRIQAGYYGSADMLDFMGVYTDLNAEDAARLVEETGIAFITAKKYHPALERTLTEQTESQIRALLQTVIGPLMNPAGAKHYLLGIHNAQTVQQVRQVIENLEGLQALVLHGQDGADQINLNGRTDGYRWDGKTWTEITITAESLGLRCCSQALLQTATPQENAHLITGILEGKIHDARRDVLLANAAAALWIGGKADCLTDGVALAASLIDSGAVSHTFAALRSKSMALRK